jgi:hypothetical protein
MAFQFTKFWTSLCEQTGLRRIEDISSKSIPHDKAHESVVLQKCIPADKPTDPNEVLPISIRAIHEIARSKNEDDIGLGWLFKREDPPTLGFFIQTGEHAGRQLKIIQADPFVIELYVSEVDD